MELMGLYKVQLFNKKGKCIYTQKVIDWNRRAAYHTLLFGHNLPIHHMFDSTRIRDAKDGEAQGIVIEKNTVKRKNK